MADAPRKDEVRLVVSYDVSEDRRRRRLAARLVGRLERVQYSVFEGTVRRATIHEILTLAAKEIDPSTDSVRAYPLCARCRELIEVLGTGLLLDDEDEDLVV